MEEVSNEVKVEDIPVTQEQNKIPRPLFCKRCGARLAADGLFCENCGLKIE